VKACLHEVKTFPSHRVFADKIRNQRQMLEYVLQVRKEGYGDSFDSLDKTARSRSPVRHDIYERDRVLFKPNTGLAKNGTFGDFWAAGFNEKKMWSRICDETATVARNYENPIIRSHVHEIHKKFGIPLSRVKWALCLSPTPDLLKEASPRGRLRAHPSRPSSGLVGVLYRSKHSRHSIPATKRTQPVGVRLSGEIDPNGSPTATHTAGLQERLNATCEGLLRDTKGRQGMGCFWDVLSASRSWIGMVLGLFRKKQLRNSVQKTFGLGP
jgi:hypothetical protein